MLVNIFLLCLLMIKIKKVKTFYYFYMIKEQHMPQHTWRLNPNIWPTFFKRDKIRLVQVGSSETTDNDGEILYEMISAKYQIKENIGTREMLLAKLFLTEVFLWGATMGKTSPSPTVFSFIKVLC